MADNPRYLNKHLQFRPDTSRIIIPAKKEFDVQIVIGFNTLTKETQLHISKGAMNEYGIMTLCLQHAALLNTKINMVSAPQGESIQESGDPNGTA